MGGRSSMLRASRWLGAVALLACSSFTAGASAQTADPVAATELFKQGRDAMAREDLKTACPKFAESLRLDEKVGTLLNLAECEERTGKIAAARQHLQRAIDLARAQSDDRLGFAQQRFAAIDPRVPRLIVKLAAGAPNTAVVKRDDLVLGAATLDTPLPVEPGPHVVTVTAPGHAARTFETTLKPSDRGELVVDVGPKQEESGAPVAQGEHDGAKTTRTWGFVIVGVGAVGLGLGTAFGVTALAKNSDSKATCDANNVCDPTGKSLRDDARSAGNVSTVAFALGAAAVAAGIVVVLTAGSGSKSSAQRIEAAPIVGHRGGGVALQGRW